MNAGGRAASVLLACGAITLLAVARGPDAPRAALPCSMSAQSMLESAELGLQYLVHAQRADGSFVYIYEARTNRDAGDYNVLRHEGAALVLAQGAQRFRRDEFGLASARALEWLDRITVADAGRGGLRLREEEAPDDVRLGSLGLGVTAWLAAGDAGAVDAARARDRAKGLGREILAMQRATGQLASVVPVRGGDDPEKRVLDFHPGEGALALVRLFLATRERLWLDAAVRAISFEVDLRAGLPAGRPDAWLPRAAADLYEISPDPRWPEAGRRLGAKLRAASPPLPGSALGEANVAWARLARAAGDRASEDAALGAALTAACVARGRQIDRSRASALPDPAASLGGIPGDEDRLAIRIDNVQHAVGLWLALAALDGGPR